MQNVTKRITSFESNLAIENSEEALLAIEKAIKDRFGADTLIEKITDRESQLLGIDYKITNPKTQRTLNIDVKVRLASTVEKYWYGKQDAAFEFKQGKSDVGWATDPKLATDYVLFLWLGLENTSKYVDCYWIRHKHVKELISDPQTREDLVNRRGAKIRAGNNGYALSHFICINLQVVEEFVNYYKSLEAIPADRLLVEA